jgi:hypothetical protein
MMNLVEIDIGKPPHKDGYNDNDGWLCTAVIVNGYNDILSENSVSYWFDLDQYNIGGRIAKDSPEGKQLSRIIADKTSVEYTKKTIFGWCLKRLQMEEFTRIFDWVRDEAFKEGKNAVRKSLALVIEIED